MKDTIFISHATHEDDFSASWLAAKLRLLGYKVWIDIDDLSTGDSFNTIIKPVIKNQTKIFIALTTVSYSDKANDQNSGVSRELNCATTVDVKELSHNFIFPIKFDDVDFKDFPYQYIGWNGIDFEGNWQNGLITLVKELEKIQFPKSDNVENPLSFWFKSIRVQNKVIEKQEKYFSNWFQIHLPEKIYIHEPYSTDKIFLSSIPFPLTIEAKRIITFTDKDTIQKFIQIRSSFEFQVTSFSSNDSLIVDEFYNLIEPRKKLIRLLNNTFNNHMSKCGLVCWVRGKRSKTKTFYFKNNIENRKSISLKRYGKPRGRRDIVGTTTETVNNVKTSVNWSFGLTCEAYLDPIPHYKIFYTLIFSDEDFKRFDKTIQHNLRRSVPNGWYNRKWFESLLAAMLKLSPSSDSKTINISITFYDFMVVENEPLYGTSNKGYIEPNDL